MNSRNDNVRDFCGVTAWHNAGYTGSRVSIGSAENFVDASPSTHKYKTWLIANEFAPDAKYYYFKVSATSANRTIEQRKALIKSMLEENGVSVYFASLSGVRDASHDEVLSDFPELILLFSAGNDGDDGSSGYIRSKTIYGVGAVEIKWSKLVNGKPAEDAEVMLRPAGYSSVSEDVDFAAPTKLYLKGSETFSGTSCAAPALAGMCALVNDFFIDKTGKPLTRDKMYQFLKDNCIDLKDEGHDTKTGWGLPILPHPDTIDISKYAEVTKEEVKVEVQEPMDIENQNFKIQKMQSPNRRVKPDRKIEYIVIHYFGSLSTAKQTANYFCTPGIQASAHYVIDEGEIVYNVVDDKDVAWHCGGNGVGTLKYKCTNDNSIGIEVRPRIMNSYYANDASYKGWYFDKAVIDRLVEVTKWLMNKYDIDVDHVVRHYETTGKLCPRPFVGDDINIYYGTTGNEQWAKFKARLEEDDEMLTYEQFKAYMERYEAERDNLEGSHWSQVERDWANAQGIINGDSNGKMRWKAPITREEYAVTEYRQSLKK